MLNSISKLLTGEILHVLSDMGHGDVLILADGNFPAASVAKSTTYGKAIELPGADVADVFAGLSPLFPIDVDYSEAPIAVMDLTDSDKAKGMARPEAWDDFGSILQERYPDAELSLIERYDFYAAAAKAYAIIHTGEERQYGNLLLVKGVVL